VCGGAPTLDAASQCPGGGDQYSSIIDKIRTIELHTALSSPARHGVTASAERSFVTPAQKHRSVQCALSRRVHVSCVKAGRARPKQTTNTFGWCTEGRLCAPHRSPEEEKDASFWLHKLTDQQRHRQLHAVPRSDLTP
jgi:hypothetical protein